MNFTHLEHAAYALLMQVIIGLAAGDWWAGAAAGAFFFIGREHAQAERRAGNEFRAFLPSAWNLDSVLDFVVPTIAVCGVAWYV